MYSASNTNIEAIITSGGLWLIDAASGAICCYAACKTASGVLETYSPMNQ